MTAVRSAMILAAAIITISLPRFAQAAGVGKGAIGIAARVSLGNLGRPTNDTFSGQPNFNGMTIGSVGIGARISLGAVGYSRPETTDTAGHALIHGMCSGTTVSSNRIIHTPLGGHGTLPPSFSGIGG